MLLCTINDNDLRAVYFPHTIPNTKFRCSTSVDVLSKNKQTYVRIEDPLDETYHIQLKLQSVTLIY